MFALARWLIPVVLAGLCGCGGDDGPDCEALSGEQPTLVIGGTTNGLDAFVAIEDGDDLKVMINQNGLYMLPPSLRIGALYPGQAGRVGDDRDPEVAIRAYVDNDYGTVYVGGTDVSVEDGAKVGVWPRYGFATTDAGGELVAVQVVFVAGIDVLSYLNQVVTLEATVTDACGRSAQDQLEVVAFWSY